MLAALPEEDRNDFTTFLKVALQEDAEPEAFEAPLSELLTLLREIFPQETEAVSAETLMKRLPENAQRTAKRFITLKEEQPDMLRQIIETGALPRKPVPEEKGEVTIDTLLQEYFRSEVDDHIQLVRQTLSKPFSEKAFKDLITYFKSLKEVSMIHGHSGIEFFITKIVKTLNSALVDERSVSAKTPAAFEEIFAELQKVEHFGKKNERQIARINELVAALDDSLSREIEIQASKEIETPAVFSFDNKEMIFKALGETLAALFKKCELILTHSAPEQKAEKISALLKRKAAHLAILHEGMPEAFFGRLAQVYSYALSLPKDQQKAALDKTGNIWRQVISGIRADYDFSTLDKAFAGLLPAEDFALDSETQVTSAFIDSQRSLWQATEPLLAAALQQGNMEARQKVQTLFRVFANNIRLLGYEGYRSAAHWFLALSAAENDKTYSAEETDEIAKSFMLILERIEAKGSQGSSDDVIEILQEVLAETESAEQAEPQKQGAVQEQISPEPVSPEPVSPEPASPAADLQEPVSAEAGGQELSEDEQFFREEAAELINNARRALSELGRKPDERGAFKDVETALHSIRSSAHMLNLQKVVEFSVTLEETAEMFESAEVPMPAELLPEMEQALSVLEKLIKGEDVDVQLSERALENVLNRLILEEQGEDLDVIRKELEEEEKTVTEDQPLFAENEDFDEELLQIFKEESEKFIATLEKENEHLKKQPDDLEAFKRLDYAAHSLKSSAKMLGFREISQLTDGLEEIVEAINKKQIENSMELQESISTAIRTIKKLRNGEKISSAYLAEVIKQIDISEKRIHSAAPRKKEDRKFVAEVFLNEADELLEKLNADFLELEKMPESATLLANILRNLHTLKGSALMVRFEKIGEMAHKLEDYFQVYKRQNAVVKQEMLNPAFTTLDIIEEMIKSLREGNEEAAPKFTSKLAEIDNKLYFYQNYDSSAAPSAAVVQDEEEAGKAKMPKQGDDSVIKINTTYLDKLINMATELVVNRTELAGHFDTLKNLLANIEIGRKQIHQANNVLDDLVEDLEYAREEKDEDGRAASGDEEEQNIQAVSNSIKDLSEAVDKISNELNRLSRGFEKNIQQISNLSKSLHTDILKVRMLPIEHLFNRFPRMVRDLAAKQKKKINLTIEGNNAELDRAMIEALVDPLMHILRNAVDHGIESGSERTKLKKNKTGNITLRARQEKNQVLIDVSDDGRGIDLEKVKKRLIEREIVSEENIAHMTEAEILDYIFYPEFSTKDETGKVSGRGVGLDVVANHIQKLKGIIRIRTEKNRGTTFSLRVPLTLVISQALMTRQGNTQIAIPLVAIQESLEVERRDILMDDKRKYVQVHGKLLPFITLETILNYQDEEDMPARRPVVILHDAGVSVALGIGEITGRQEIVIKSLGDQMQNIEYIAGGTILSNGEVALILDYAAIIKLVEFQFFGNVKVSRAAGTPGADTELQIAKSDPTINKILEKKVISGRKPRILVVDDSSSVRTFVGSVLEKANFTTIRASDGKQAMDIIDKEIIDLIITDLEMPEMDGFELIKKTRAQKKYDDIPIVILTGRSGQKQREKGEAIGANSFIGKPFKESDLLRVVSDFIEIDLE